MNKKGRNNKLNIGDIVEVKLNYIKYMVEHSVENYSIGGNGEFENKFLPEITSLFHSHLKKKSIKGIVIGYGANDYSKKADCLLKNKFCIKVILRGEYGVFSIILSERNLKKVNNVL